MTDNQQIAHFTKPSGNSPMVSVREQSNSTLQAAIRSPSDEGATLKRVNDVLGAYYDPHFDPETKAGVRHEFVRALAGKPQWAVHRAFDAWVKSGVRRPTPGEIVILVDRELEPIAKEIARRAANQAAAARERDAARKDVVTDEARARIMAEAGMTEDRLRAVQRFPMARNIGEMEQLAAPKPVDDWTRGLPDDDPRVIALRASRAASVVVSSGRGDDAE